jgi:hypothetical protein
MSGARISKAERRIQSANRRFVKSIREAEHKTFGNNAESTKVERAFSRIAR